MSSSPACWRLIFRASLSNPVAAVVRTAGVEPARGFPPQDFKSCVSTSSTTSAWLGNDLSYATLDVIQRPIILTSEGPTRRQRYP
jgi:hypothetical protein